MEDPFRLCHGYEFRSSFLSILFPDVETARTTLFDTRRSTTYSVRVDGVGVLDPHGDLIDEVLARIPEERRDDVVLIDPADPDYVAGWNLLGAQTDLEKELLASDLTATFQRLATSWGDQMSTVLSNAVLAFLNSKRGGTILDLRKFLVDEGFRKQFVETVEDEYIASYWREDFPLIASALLGSLLVSKIHQVTLSRQELAKEARTPYFLYLDEFHEQATPSMATMFSGVRKYGLALTVAHQDLYQLRQTLPGVERAVLANSHTRICFRVGDDDAKKLADGFSDFDAKSLTDLGIGQAIVRVGRRTDDFNLKTFDLPKQDRSEAAETLSERRRQVLEHWGAARQRVAEDEMVAPEVERTDVSAQATEELGSFKTPSTEPSGSSQDEPEAAPAPSRPKINKRTLDYLEHVARRPFVPVKERNDALRISAWKGQATKKEILEAGYAKEVSINPGGRGGQFKLLELTSEGREILRLYGIAAPIGHGRGGIEHQWWVSEIAGWLESQGIESRIEDESSGARVDLVFESQKKKIAVEVETSSGYEIENISKDLATSSFESVVSLISVQSSIQKLEQRVDGEPSAARSVRIIPLQEFKEGLARHISPRPSPLGRQNQKEESRRTRRSRSAEAPVPSEVFFPEHGVLTTPIAAEYLGLSPATLETQRVRGGGPVFVKLGRRVVYRREDLDAWINERRRRSTSDDGS